MSPSHPESSPHEALPDNAFNQQMLAQWRGELDELDRRLLATVARRNELVRRIAQAKEQAGAAPLFDRRREREVYRRVEQAAAAVGLSPELAHRLFQLLIEQSHQIQESLNRAQSLLSTADQPRRFLIIGGGGRMGQLFQREFKLRGHRVDILEPGDHQDPQPRFEAADVVLVSVPMAQAVPVVEQLVPQLPPDTLLCDVNSLKSDVCRAMGRYDRGESVGLHPMFGATVRSLRRQKIVACPIRRGPQSEWLLREFGQMGLEVIESDPETHDLMMAVVQVLMHFATLVVGTTLQRTGLPLEQSLQYTSPIYRLELALVGRLFAQNPDLYAEIEMSNPYGAETRRRFRDAAIELAELIDSGDRDRFRSRFGEIADYFADFSQQAMQLSDLIIDAVVAQP